MLLMQPTNPHIITANITPVAVASVAGSCLHIYLAKAPPFEEDFSPASVAALLSSARRGGGTQSGPRAWLGTARGPRLKSSTGAF